MYRGRVLLFYKITVITAAEGRTKKSCSKGRNAFSFVFQTMDIYYPTFTPPIIYSQILHRGLSGRPHPVLCVKHHAHSKKNWRCVLHNIVGIFVPPISRLPLSTLWFESWRLSSGRLLLTGRVPQSHTVRYSNRSLILASYCVSLPITAKRTHKVEKHHQQPRYKRLRMRKSK